MGNHIDIYTDALASNKVGISLEWPLCLYDLETWNNIRQLVIGWRIQIPNHALVTKALLLLHSSTTPVFVNLPSSSKVGAFKW